MIAEMLGGEGPKLPPIERAVFESAPMAERGTQAVDLIEHRT